MTDRRALDKIALWGGLIIALLYWEVIIEYLSALPRVIPATLVFGLIAWTGAALATDQIESVPALILFSGVAGVIIGIYPYVGSWGLPVGQLGTIITTIPLGLIAWFGAVVIVAGITSSVLGLDMEPHRFERIDDPYGDPHAAEILEEPEA